MLLLSTSLSIAVRLVAQLVGLGLLAGLVSGLVALSYRWYARERVPRGLAVLAGLSAVAVYLNTTPILAEVLDGGEAVLEIEAAMYNIAAFVVGAAGTLSGVRAGDRLGTDLFATTGTGGVDGDVSTLVQSVGRVISVELPEEIADVVGYDPVAPATKETLSGRTFLFPRRLAVAELRERLVSRLKTDYGVGHVDVDLAADGTVEYLAVGSRAAGIGPTLPPATTAVAIRADPAHAASAGDLVQVWDTGPMRRVLTGELRGVAGDAVTVAIDAADTPKLDPTRRYKLVTLPVEDRPEREFASLLRAADETMATITVEAGSALEGVPVGALDLTVAAITREDRQPEPLPARDRVLAAEDVLYAIATPDALRRVEAAANAPPDAGGPVADAPPAATADEPSPGTGPLRTGSAEDPESDLSDDDVPDAPSSGADSPSSTDSPASGADEPDAPGGDRRPDDGDADTVPPGGAFPDAEDLPGIDAERAVPSLATDEEADDEEADDEEADDEEADDEDEPADAVGDDGADGTGDGAAVPDHDSTAPGDATVGPDDGAAGADDGASDDEIAAAFESIEDDTSEEDGTDDDVTDGDGSGDATDGDGDDGGPVGR